MIDTQTARAISFCNKTDESQRLESVCRLAGLSQKAWIDAYRNHRFTVHGKKVGRNARIEPGECAFLAIDDEETRPVAPAESLRVIWEDPFLLVVDKPAGVSMHAREDSEDSMSRRAQWLFQQTGTKRRVRFVNRLDRDTTGVVVIAKDRYTHGRLTADLSNGIVRKVYVLLTADIEPPIQKERTLSLPLQKESEGHRYVPDPSGKPTRTDLRFLCQTETAQLWAARLVTGRTHQIRAHMAAIGKPILGDALYGGAPYASQCLHAYAYVVSSWEGRERQFLCPPPRSFAEACQRSEESMRQEYRRALDLL